MNQYQYNPILINEGLWSNIANSAKKLFSRGAKKSIR